MPVATFALAKDSGQRYCVSMLKTLILAALLIGCTHVNRVALATSSAMLLCDWGQTRAEAKTGWASGHELNPMLGAAPSPGRVDAYMLGALALNVGAWLITPRRFKSIPALGVVAFEVDPVTNNFHTTPGTCGI